MTAARTPAVAEPSDVETRAPRERARTLLFLITDDWYVVSHRLPLVRAAEEAGWRVVIATEVIDHLDELKQTGAEVVHVRWWRRGGEHRTRNPFRMLFDIVRLYRSVRPDIVHCVSLRPVVFGGLAAKFVRVPGIVNALTGQGFVFVSASGLASLLRPAITRVLRTVLSPRRGVAVRTIVENPDDRDMLLHGKLAGAKTIVIIRGAGVDLKAFAPVPHPQGIPTVILPARMLWEKGVAEFVEAARSLRRDGVPGKFLLAGRTVTGNSRYVTPQQLSDWQREGVVEWLGHQNDMAAVLRRAHIVALPSYGEGLPKALLEAAAAGLPIVATDVAGCREVVHDGRNGFLVPARDSKVLAEKLRELLLNADLRESMGRAGREIAVAEFGVSHVNAQTLQIYEDVWAEVKTGSK